jgi:hypothetical protein
MLRPISLRQSSEPACVFQAVSFAGLSSSSEAKDLIFSFVGRLALFKLPIW